MAEAVIVADEIVWETLNRNCLITPLQLRGIMFMMELKYRKEKHDGLNTREPFVKYPYGPLVEDVRKLYEIFGGENIRYIPDYRYLTEENDKYIVKSYAFSHYDLAKEQRDFIANNLEQYLKITQWDLVRLTQEDQEWKDRSDGEWYNLQKSIEYYAKKGVI